MGGARFFAQRRSRAFRTRASAGCGVDPAWTCPAHGWRPVGSGSRSVPGAVSLDEEGEWWRARRNRPDGFGTAGLRGHAHTHRHPLSCLVMSLRGPLRRPMKRCCWCQTCGRPSMARLRDDGPGDLGAVPTEPLAFQRLGPRRVKFVCRVLVYRWSVGQIQCQEQRLRRCRLDVEVVRSGPFCSTPFRIGGAAAQFHERRRHRGQHGNRMSWLMLAVVACTATGPGTGTRRWRGGQCPPSSGWVGQTDAVHPYRPLEATTPLSEGLLVRWPVRSGRVWPPLW